MIVMIQIATTYVDVELWIGQKDILLRKTTKKQGKILDKTKIQIIRQVQHYT